MDHDFEFDVIRMLKTPVVEKNLVQSDLFTPLWFILEKTTVPHPQVYS